MASPVILTLKRCGNTSFESLSVCTSAAVWPWEKGKNSQKSHKSVIFHVFGENPAEPIFSKICMWGEGPDAITCTKFQNKILRGCDFTWGQNFDFPIDFWMAITTVQRYCASLYIGLFLRVILCFCAGVFSDGFEFSCQNPSVKTRLQNDLL